jgi:regulatory protein
MDAVDQVRSWLSAQGVVVPPPNPQAAGPGRPAPEVGNEFGAALGAEPAPDRPAGSGGADQDRRRGAGRRGGRSRRGEPPAAGPHDLEADPESVARTIVLRKLAAQARTRHELAAALAARDVPEDVAEAVLDRMEAVGLVDDRAFARDWVESRQQRRTLSRSALRRELQTKGVDRDQIDEALSGVEADDEVEAALALASKKLRSLRGLERDVQYRRLAGALARRGFNGGVASTVLSQLLDGPQE